MTATSTRTFRIDPAHTSVGFTVRHLMIAKVRGSFGAVTGTIELPPSGSVPVSLNAQIETASIDTRDPQRNAHLMSGDFFDVEKFPQLTFSSTDVAPIDASHFRLTGDLQMHGVTKSVTFPVEITGQGKNPLGDGERVAYEAAFQIKRSDFGLTWNMTLEAGGLALSDEVHITLDVQAVG